MLTKPFRPEELRNVIQNTLAAEKNDGSTTSRFAKLEEYTGGDQHFTIELLTLFIKNIEELQYSCEQAIAQKKLAIIDEYLHKSKTTLTVLDASSILKIVSDVRRFVEDGKEIEFIQTLKDATDALIADIQNEIRQISF